MKTAPETSSPATRGERTRLAILDAAEEVFAECGFDGARLGEIAERVGIQRPAISYHFRDKRDLYQAVLRRLLGDLFERTQAALAGRDPLLLRVERAVSAWLDFVAARPALAKIALREIAASRPEDGERLRGLLRPFYELVEELEATEGDGDDARPERRDPAQVTSVIAGATLFFVGAIPAFSPERDFDPSAPAAAEAHRRLILDVTRFLLGPAEPSGPRPGLRAPLPRLVPRPGPRRDGRR